MVISIFAGRNANFSVVSARSTSSACRTNGVRSLPSESKSPGTYQETVGCEGRPNAAKEKHRGLFYLGLILALALNTWLIFVNGKVNMRSLKWATIPLTLINALTAIVVYILLSKCLTDHPKLGTLIPVRWLERVGMTSIVYLCTNHPMIKFARRIAEWIAADAPKLQILLTFAISMALMYGISELILRTKLRVIVGKR